MDIAICAGITALEVTVLSTPVAWTNWYSLFRFAGYVALHYAALQVYRVVVYPRLFSPLRHVPGPKSSNILFGEELNKFTAPTPVTHQLQWSKQWPDAPFIRYLSIAGKEVLMCNSVAACKALLQTYCYDTIKPPFFFKLIKEVSGTGLLFAEGEYHKQQRRLLNNPFSVPNTKKLLPLFHAKAKALSNVFDAKIGTQAYGSLDVPTVISKATLDIIGVALLGLELDELSGSGEGFAEHYSEMLHPSMLGAFIWVVNAFVPIRRFLPLEANRRWNHAKTQLRVLLRRHIRSRNTDLDEGTSKGAANESSDMLSYMLEEARAYKETTGKKPWTEQEIDEHLITFLGAGHETATGVLTWSLYTLATRQDIQTRLRSEIEELVNKSPTPDYDELSSLPFLHNFFREILRAYSPISSVPRETVKDLVVDRLFIPKGTQVEMSIPVIHFHPHIWGQDAHTFNPDRWDRVTGDAASPYAWEPFIQGPRQCPGKNFGMIEVKAIMVALLTRFRFVGIERYDGSGGLMTDEETKVGNGIKLQNPSITNCPTGGLIIRFERC